METELGIGNRGKLAAGGEESILDDQKRLVIHGTAGDEEQIPPSGHEILILPKNSAQAAFSAVALHGVADSGDRGDHAHSPGEVSGVFAGKPPSGENPAVNPATLFANTAKIALAANVLLRAKTHGASADAIGGKAQTTVKRLRPLARRAARTLRPPVVALRARNPILRARFKRCGRKVGCMKLAD